LKLKYERNKPQKLWGETHKKLHKFYNFIEEADENSECCLVHSNLGNNRCCAVIIAYLMKKFLWTFDKTVNYVRSKKVEMKLSQNYTTQLKQFEQLLQQDNPLSNDWRRPYLSEEERVIVNTYNNTIEIKYEQPLAKV
jgi:protein-tyrosine phosphatase